MSNLVSFNIVNKKVLTILLTFLLSLLIVGCSANSKSNDSTTKVTTTTTQNSKKAKSDYAKYIDGEMSIEEARQHYCKDEDYPKEITCKINSIDYDNKTINLNIVEWITLQDKERLKELNISEDSLTNGYYIYEENNENIEYKITDDTDTFSVVEAHHLKGDIYNIYVQDAVFLIYVKNNIVTDIVQRYQP